jgi:ABC-type multidrug transport system ATPase subunit
MADGPPEVDVRYLHKVYGKPGPLKRAWRAHQRFLSRVVSVGGIAFDTGDARSRLLPLLMLAAGAAYVAFALQTVFWRSVFAFVSAALASALLRELRRARGRADERGRVTPGGPEGWLAVLMPWAALAWMILEFLVLPSRGEGTAEVRRWVPSTLAVVILVVQLGRRTAVRVSRGAIPITVDRGKLRRVRTVWRQVSRRVFGFDLPQEEVHALNGVHFTVKRGMVGVLGPNGAGKTTLLRQLAGILEPTTGTIRYGGVPVGSLRRYLARWVGYLPQDFGLPGDLTAREYLDYYSLLYEIRPEAERSTRVQRLLDEVGLAKKADERISSYSGGMRQRVAVARTLLRLPSVIIVDEPTVGLDPRERIRFRNLLSRLSEGRIVLFSTHVVEDVEVACERVIVFARGRVIFDGPPDELAHEARGRVWRLSLLPGEEKSLPEKTIVVDQVPEPTGVVRTRVLAPEAPLDGAESVAPTLEDGYMWLVGEGAGA